MSKMDGYMTGINVGGWISQYFAYDPDLKDIKHHFDTYITEEDIAFIAASGFDHIRVPVDYRALTEEGGFVYLDAVIGWTKTHRLNMVIDLHDAPGYNFFQNDNILFESGECQEQLVSLWREIAGRYKNEGQNIRYELLNEIKDDTPDRWNSLAERLIGEIRSVDAKHTVIVGGIQMNNITKVKDIKRFGDDKIVYTFHTYEPFPLTHQKAHFVTFLKDMDKNISYPCSADDYNNALKRLENVEFTEKDINKEYMRAVFSPAIDFLRETGLPLYCGEFGVIENADMRSRANFVNDVAELCIEYGIGRAMWNYKELDFKLVDIHRNVVSGDLLKAASLRK